MNHKNENPDASGNTAWDVFRYVAGELSASEEHDFETRLESDQHLREQVSGMVASMSIVKESLTPSEVKPSDPLLARSGESGSRKNLVLLLVGLAALVAVAGISIVQIGQSPNTGTVSDSVAMAWVESLAVNSGDGALVMSDLDFELAASEPVDEFENDFMNDDESDWVFDAIVAAEEIERTNL